jgi:hypothetical protein
MSARRALHAAVVSLPRPAGTFRRSALAGGLAIALMVLATSPGGAEPQGGTGQPTNVVLSQQVIRAVDHAPPEAGHASDGQAMARAAAMGGDLEAAREQETAARTALAEASTALEKARDARDTALSWAEAAQDELMRARIRLGDLIVAEEAASADLRGAVRRVEGERRGSRAHRSAFTGWQMAAVTERAAHLRRTVSARVGAERFKQLQVAEAELTDAELALGRATSAHLKAARAAESATARVTQMEAEALDALDPPVTLDEGPTDASPELPATSRTADGSRP